MPKNTTAALSSIEHITQSILILRGRRVLLDNDLAKLYSFETRRVNEQVRISDRPNYCIANNVPLLSATRIPHHSEVKENYGCPNFRCSPGVGQLEVMPAVNSAA